MELPEPHCRIKSFTVPIVADETYPPAYQVPGAVYVLLAYEYDLRGWPGIDAPKPSGAVYCRSENLRRYEDWPKEDLNV